ncbi:MAG: hypothetical protein ACJ791_12385 [Gemmatimonadaceae bacterium]
MTRWLRTFGIVAVVAPLAAATGAAQSRSFAGTWKLNLAKSQLGGLVYSVSRTPSGMIHYSGGGFEADFDLAGKEHVMPSGVAVIGKELSPTSWDLTFRMNGKTVQRSRLTLTGNSISSVADVIGANGKTLRQKTIDTRVSGGPGFLGKWKAGEVAGATSTLKMALDGAQGIRITIPEFQMTVKGRFDGKDYPVMQAAQATKFTNAFANVGNTIKVTGKLNGKLFTEEIYTLSRDGKTLTDESTAIATGEKTRAVFDRQ